MLIDCKATQLQLAVTFAATMVSIGGTHCHLVKRHRFNVQYNIHIQAGDSLLVDQKAKHDETFVV